MAGDEPVLPIVAISGVVQDAWLVASACAIAAMAGWGCVRLRGTTLSAAAGWAFVAATTFAVVEGVIAWRGLPPANFGTQLARYVAATATFCPLMAVLGAKRPQDKGWQWVVACLWLVLLAPAGQAVVARARELELPWIWLTVLASLAMAGLLNYLPTRWAISALAFAAAQLKLIIYPRFAVDVYEGLIGAATAALVAAAIPTFWKRKPKTADAQTEQDLLSLRWLAFRNGWGAFWALRVMQRINQTAELRQWPVRLAWKGFHAVDGAAGLTNDSPVWEQVRQAMDSVLWRFERMSRAEPSSDGGPPP